MGLKFFKAKEENFGNKSLILFATNKLMKDLEGKLRKILLK